MKFSKELNLALKIIWVFAVLTTIFKLMQNFSPIIFFGISRDGFKNYIEVNLIWFIVVSSIIAGLSIYISKTDGRFNLTFIHNPLIQLTAGLLIVFEGIYNLLTSVPVAITNVITFHQFTSEFENVIGTSRGTLLTSNIIPSLINLLQVLLGLYLILHKLHNKEIEQP